MRALSQVGRTFATIFTLGQVPATYEGPLGGLKDGTHECVKMFVECENCGHRYTKTAELLNKGKGLYNGYYKRYENRRDSSTKRRSYAYMKYTYESMWASWSANAHCGDWARAFFAKMEAYEMFVIVGFFKRKYFWNVD